jgi:hypothetical protein
VPSEHIQADVVRIALDRVEGLPFERFANAFYSSLAGVSFVPQGGVKDGGADARDGMIFEDGTRARPITRRAWKSMPRARSGVPWPGCETSAGTPRLSCTSPRVPSDNPTVSSVP